MYTSYSLEKVASSSHTERLASAEQHRLARELRRQRGQHTTQLPDVPATAPTRVPVRVPRQRRWLGAFVPAGR